MPEPNPVEFLTDPLSLITRIERRNLLLASTAGILVAKAGLLPTQISALGISLSVSNQSAFIVVMALTVTYFVFAFLLYGIADFFVWRKKYQDYLEHVDAYMESWSQEDQRYYDERRERVPEIGWLYRGAKPIAFIRAFFEHCLPVFIGLYAAIILWFRVSYG